ncbi:hypothetical protein [Paraburkholderia humisilvae]|uniref:hypothetical protein n=1 Tax=Paraburkholderia humisilvae TaxID=627669 RepID=UPI001583B743|nr:hypothetical protein [Paraburkholderia humisilvae]
MIDSIHNARPGLQRSNSLSNVSDRQSEPAPARPQGRGVPTSQPSAGILSALDLARPGSAENRPDTARASDQAPSGKPIDPEIARLVVPPDTPVNFGKFRMSQDPKVVREFMLGTKNTLPNKSSAF